MATKVSDWIVEATPWLDKPAEKVRAALTPVVGTESPRFVRDALYGTWLGHALHPAVVLVPIGMWTSSLVLDVAGEERAADLTLGLGLLGAVGAAATGAAQWQEAIGEQKPRRLGLLHSSLNTVATVLYGASWVLRRRGARGAGIATATAGYGVTMASAWLGGDLSYTLGIGVNQTAFEEPPTGWTDVLAEGDLADEKPVRVEVGNVPVMVVRQGGEIFALSANCSHLSGPLDEGEIEGDTVVCPWHGSVFCLKDGRALHAPATAPQPTYEVRVEGGRVALRPAENFAGLPK